ncbi:MAG TPA: recombinase family protein [Ktedonobacteraceae bacterium]|nr:recombinase family protein [Ktedonobacteraceae bacterium]
MHSNGVRIIKVAAPAAAHSSYYDNTHSYMAGYTLDLSRKTAALMRQSRKDADEDNPESRLRQEGLVRVAADIRVDHDPLMVIPCDEGSGVSGQKKIYERPKFLALWKAIQDGTVGSIIVAREDRLFRDRFLTQATQFAEECAKRGVLLIVAGRRCYDFRIQDDFKAFLRKMEEAYGYIDTHIRYMIDMKNQKLQRGEWVGGALSAPYALDRLAMQTAKEQRKLIKEFGASEADELLITKAYRPVIYEPWHEIAVGLFKRFKLYDYAPSRLARYVEEKKYVFPLPPLEAKQRYYFKPAMHCIPGLGYTFSNPSNLQRWFRSLSLIGFVCIGKDEEGNRVYLEGAFEAAIPRDLFEPCYESITGYTIFGEPSSLLPNRKRTVRKKEPTDGLLTRRFSSPDDSYAVYVHTSDPNNLYYYARPKHRSEETEVSLRDWEHTTLWTLPTKQFDRPIVERLADLAEHDKELANRVEQYYEELTENRASEKNAIVGDISQLEALIARYDELITTPAEPLTKAQESRYLKKQAAAEANLEEAKAALIRYERSEPAQFIPAFYRILGQAPGEFWGLDQDHQRRMMTLLVDDIQVENISPHFYRLRLKWKDPVAQHWDGALIYKCVAIKGTLSNNGWTKGDEAILQQLYVKGDRMELSKALPNKSYKSMKGRAVYLGVKRDTHMRTNTSIMDDGLCFDDWQKACEVLEADINSEEGAKILDMLNYYARTTPRKCLSFWWLLPVVDINGFDGDLSDPAIA